MKVIDSTVIDFKTLIAGKKILCFGSGDYFKLFVFDFGDVADIVGVLDNDIGKCGKLAVAGTVSRRIFSVKEAAKMLDLPGIILVICASAYREIIAGLHEIRAFDKVTCFVYAQIKYSSIKPSDTVPQTSDTLQIPPVIHYCWFGKKPLPDNLKRCVDSWRRLCPGYEIVEWNEQNYDVYKNAWTAAAFEQRKWAYIADFTRIEIIESHGGIYLDTDVELLKNLDALRYNKGFIATEAHGGVNLGSGFGAVAKLGIFSELLSDFEREYINEVVFCSNVGRETEVFWRHGYRLNGVPRIVKDVAVLPYNIMTPVVNDTGKDDTTDATVSVHHFNRGWKEG